MIVIIDAFGLLIILILGFQGYKDGSNLQKSYLLPALLSFIIFYKTFAFVYSFLLSVIPSTLVAGILTTILINLSLMMLFHASLKKITQMIQTRFFLPELTLHTKSAVGTGIGFLAGYIFVTGAVTSLQDYTHNKLLQESAFYRILHRPTQFVTPTGKIDNIPSLKELYSEQNVVRFNFAEQELIAILQMIRAISNQNAQSLLQQLRSHVSINDVYQNLIDLYLSINTSQIEEKYIVDKEIIHQLQEKIGYTPHQITAPSKSSRKIKSISDIIDAI